METIWDKITSIRIGSNKPYSITARDAIIIAVATLVVTLLVYALKYLYDGTHDFINLIWQTLLVTFALQFVYEYGGLNAMVEESSLRYAKGTPLGIFKSTRRAMIYNVYNSLQADQQNETNLAKLVAILDTPAVNKILSLVKKGKSKEDIINTLGDKYSERNITLLLTLTDDSSSHEVLRASTRLIELLDEDLTRWILVHGFAGFTPVDTPISIEINPDILRQVGESTREYYKNELTKPHDYLLETYGANYQKILDKKINIKIK